MFFFFDYFAYAEAVGSHFPILCYPLLVSVTHTHIHKPSLPLLFFFFFLPSFPLSSLPLPPPVIFRVVLLLLYFSISLFHIYIFWLCVGFYSLRNVFLCFCMCICVN